MPDPEYASHEDVKAIIEAVGKSTAAISNLALKLEHQSEILEANEKRNDKRLDKIEAEAKEDRVSSSKARKELHEEVSNIKERLKPVEGISGVIKDIAVKLIGSLALTFIVGGISVFAIVKSLG